MSGNSEHPIVDDNLRALLDMIPTANREGAEECLRETNRMITQHENELRGLLLVKRRLEERMRELR